MAVADLDGDDDLDFVCTNRNRNDLTVFRQDGPRSFSALAQPLSLPMNSVPVSIVAADLDGDGDQDLVCANRGTDTLAVFLQVTPGVFQPPVLWSTGGSGPNAVAVADLDGDRRLDLIAANRSSGSVTVLFQGLTGAFEAQPPLLAGPATSSVAALDLDGDGDLACASRDSNSLRVFFQDQPRTFMPQPPLLVPAGSAGPVSIATADLDGDGDADLACANQNSQFVTVFFGRTQ